MLTKRRLLTRPSPALPGSPPLAGAIWQTTTVRPDPSTDASRGWGVEPMAVPLEFLTPVTNWIKESQLLTPTLLTPPASADWRGCAWPRWLHLRLVRPLARGRLSTGCGSGRCPTLSARRSRSRPPRRPFNLVRPDRAGQSRRLPECRPDSNHRRFATAGPARPFVVCHLGHPPAARAATRLARRNRLSAGTVADLGAGSHPRRMGPSCSGSSRTRVPTRLDTHLPEHVANQRPAGTTRSCRYRSG